MDTKYDVFISYSRKDLELVKKIKSEIDRLVGIDCWMDLDGIESGEQFEDVIINAICKCDIILFMMSANSMQSEWALDELDFAKHEKKRIVLVGIDNTEMSGKFYFRYHKYDTIIWSNEPQRAKLIKDLRKWTNRITINMIREKAEHDDEEVLGLKAETKRKENKENKIAKEEVKHESQTVIQKNEFQEKNREEENSKTEKSKEVALHQIEQNGKYGFVDDNGILVIPCQWSWADIYFYDGLCLVKDENGKWGFIDKTGMLVIPCKWDSASSFSEGFAAVGKKEIVKKGLFKKELIEKRGYINTSGNVVIPFVWTRAGRFCEGLASVMNEKGLYGYIDTKGKIVIPCEWYYSADNFENGQAKVRMSLYCKPVTIDRNGNVLGHYDSNTYYYLPERLKKKT